jgi:hypothetical protein
MMETFEASLLPLFSDAFFQAVPATLNPNDPNTELFMMLLHGFFESCFNLIMSIVDKRKEPVPAPLKGLCEKCQALRVKYKYLIDTLIHSRPDLPQKMAMFDGSMTIVLGVKNGVTLLKRGDAREVPNVEALIKRLNEYTVPARPHNMSIHSLDYTDIDLISACHEFVMYNRVRLEGLSMESPIFDELMLQTNRFTPPFFKFLLRFWRGVFLSAEDMKYLDYKPVFNLIDVVLVTMVFLGHKVGTPLNVELTSLQRAFAGIHGYCALCKESAKFKCSRCNVVRYCTAECQRADWARHKIECGQFTAEQVLQKLCLDPIWYRMNFS